MVVVWRGSRTARSEDTRFPRLTAWIDWQSCASTVLLCSCSPQAVEVKKESTHRAAEAISFSTRSFSLLRMRLTWRASSYCTLRWCSNPVDGRKRHRQHNGCSYQIRVARNRLPLDMPFRCSKISILSSAYPFACRLYAELATVNQSAVPSAPTLQQGPSAPYS